MPFTRRAGPASQAAVRRLGEEGVPPTEMVPGKVWQGSFHLETCIHALMFQATHHRTCTLSCVHRRVQRAALQARD